MTCCAGFYEYIQLFYVPQTSEMHIKARLGEPPNWWEEKFMLELGLSNVNVCLYLAPLDHEPLGTDRA